MNLVELFEMWAKLAPNECKPHPNRPHHFLVKHPLEYKNGIEWRDVSTQDFSKSAREFFSLVLLYLTAKRNWKLEFQSEKGFWLVTVSQEYEEGLIKITGCDKHYAIAMLEAYVNALSEI